MFVAATAGGILPPTAGELRNVSNGSRIYSTLFYWGWTSPVTLPPSCVCWLLPPNCALPSASASPLARAFYSVWLLPVVGCWGRNLIPTKGKQWRSISLKGFLESFTSSVVLLHRIYYACESGGYMAVLSVRSRYCSRTTIVSISSRARGNVTVKPTYT
jgi:hypothetical protein